MHHLPVEAELASLRAMRASLRLYRLCDPLGRAGLGNQPDVCNALRRLSACVRCVVNVILEVVVPPPRWVGQLLEPLVDPLERLMQRLLPADVIEGLLAAAGASVGGALRGGSESRPP